MHNREDYRSRGGSLIVSSSALYIRVLVEEIATLLVVSFKEYVQELY